MFGLIAVLGIVAALVAGVTWIERGAAAHIEARNLAVAMDVRRESEADVRRLSIDAAAAHRKEVSGYKAEIAALKAAKAAVPKVKATGRYCAPGCKVRLRK